MEDQYNYDSESADKKNQALDSLLQSKYDQDKLDEWKKKMPIPEEKPKRKYLGLVASIILLGLIICGTGIFLASNSEQPIQLAENLIQSTVLPSLEEMNSRGENTTTSDENGIFLLQAAELLKGDSDQIFEAIELLQPLGAKKNKYQLEAIWLHALANVKIGNNKKAVTELEKLSSLSNYQKDKVQILLNRINQ